MYVPVKGGEKAILASHQRLAEQRRADESVAEISIAQIMTQMRLIVDRVMTEGNLYDPELAALAIKQAQGDIAEAVFLLRAHRATLASLGSSEPLPMEKMAIQRRISATFKDLPGGQMLGPTYDYTHRLLDFSLLNETQEPNSSSKTQTTQTRLSDAIARIPTLDPLLSSIAEILPNQCDEPHPPADISRKPLAFPMNRDERLSHLIRSEEGFLTGLAYSALRGAGESHPYVGELRIGDVDVMVFIEELGFSLSIGMISVSECQILSPHIEFEEPGFSKSYGIAFGANERKAIAMAILDENLSSPAVNEHLVAQDEEFVLSHSDSLEAAGYVSHLKLPHYSDFQADLAAIRIVRAQNEKKAQKHD